MATIIKHFQSWFYALFPISLTLVETNLSVFRQQLRNKFVFFEALIFVIMIIEFAVLVSLREVQYLKSLTNQSIHLEAL